jgi:hypothetical protein
VEVINFGVSGYGTSQEYLTLQHFVWEYSPDIVLLAFLTLNDFNDNCRELADRPGILRPYFVLRGDGLELDTSFVGDPAYRSQKTRFLGSLRDWLAFHSRVHQLYDRARKILAAPQEKFMDSLERGRLGLFEGEYREPADSSWEHGWRITELLLLKMRDEVARHNARFLLVTLTNAIQVYPDSTIRRKFTDSRGITDLFYADHRLERFAHDHGIEVVTLAPIFQAYADRYKVYLHGFKNWKIGDGHWNRDGHELAGEVIASYICQKPVPPSKSSE